MYVNLSQIIKESLNVQSDGFKKIIEETTRFLRDERGKIKNFVISGRLLKLKPLGKALIIGDLHGDLESLIDIFKKSKYIPKLVKNKNTFMVFLGDYGDRGAYSIEVYYTVLKLKLLFPEQIILMRGNHEGPKDLLASPHDLPVQFQTRFPGKGANIYEKIRELFTYFCNAVLVEKRYLMVHGGLPPKLSTFEDLAYAHVKHPKASYLEDMLWSDPNDTIKGIYPSPRGAGKFFGKKITRNVLKKLGVKILIRGHEPCTEGFEIKHNGKVLTLFSRRGPPYFNERGAYLVVNLSEEFENARQLIPYIHKF